MSRRSTVFLGLATLALVLVTVGLEFGLHTRIPWLRGGATATAWFRIRALAPAGGDRAADDAFRQTQFHLLKSPYVLNIALGRSGIAALETIREKKDPVAWLERSLEIAAKNDSEVFLLRLRGERPDEIRMILEAVTTAYLAVAVIRDHEDREDLRDALRSKLKEQEREIQYKKKTYRDRIERLRADGSGSPADDEAEAAELRAEIERLQNVATQTGFQLDQVSGSLAEPPRVTLLEEATLDVAE